MQHGDVIRTIRGPCFDCDDALDDAWEKCPCHSKRGWKTAPVPKLGSRYLMRDACPSCLRRGGCAAECMLHMGEDFAQRREAQLQ